jgi:hypothetical protein
MPVVTPAENPVFTTTVTPEDLSWIAGETRHGQRGIGGTIPAMWPKMAVRAL